MKAKRKPGTATGGAGDGDGDGGDDDGWDEVLEEGGKSWDAVDQADGECLTSLLSKVCFVGSCVVQTAFPNP